MLRPNKKILFFDALWHCDLLKYIHSLAECRQHHNLLELTPPVPISVSARWFFIGGRLHWPGCCRRGWYCATLQEGKAGPNASAGEGTVLGPNAQLMILLTSPHTSLSSSGCCFLTVWWKQWFACWIGDTGQKSKQACRTRFKPFFKNWLLLVCAAAYYAGKKHNVSVHSACTIDFVYFESWDLC